MRTPRSCSAHRGDPINSSPIVSGVLEFCGMMRFFVLWLERGALPPQLRLSSMPVQTPQQPVVVARQVFRFLHRAGGLADAHYVTGKYLDSAGTLCIFLPSYLEHHERACAAKVSVQEAVATRLRRWKCLRGPSTCQPHPQPSISSTPSGGFPDCPQPIKPLEP